MAELADAQDLGSCTLRVWVQVPLTAVRNEKSLKNFIICPKVFSKHSEISNSSGKRLR